MPAASQDKDCSGDDITGLRRVRQELVDPPSVPRHDQIAPGAPVIVEVELSAREVTKVIDGIGTEVQALTFDGSIPGPLIICHEGDFVELTPKNPACNAFMHNIDFHASTGALGGGALTEVNPGEQVVLRAGVPSSRARSSTIALRAVR